MSAEPEEYFVTHHVTIEVTQLIPARSKAEAIRKVKAGEWGDVDAPGEWIEWSVISEPVAYTAQATSETWGSDADEHQALMDHQREAAGPQDDPPW